MSMCNGLWGKCKGRDMPVPMVNYENCNVYEFPGTAC